MNGLAVIFTGTYGNLWAVIVGIGYTIIVAGFFYWLGHRASKKQHDDIVERLKAQNRFQQHNSSTGDTFTNDGKNVLFKQPVGGAKVKL